MESNFFETVAQGSKSERAVCEALTREGWSIQDVTKNKLYQEQDIDFIATRDDCRRTIEVKQDNRIADTGNFLLETITNTRTKAQGWFEKCKSDVVIFHDTQNQQLLEVFVSDLRDYLATPKNKARYKEWEMWEGYGYKGCVGWLIPMSDFQEHYPVSIMEDK